MFGWLKKKQLAEQERLLFQNSMASHALRGSFMLPGGEHMLERLEALHAETTRVALSIPEKELASQHDAKVLLAVNHELRAIFDKVRRPDRKGFDDVYKRMSC